MCKCHLEINKKEASHNFDPLGQITDHDVGIGYDNDLLTGHSMPNQQKKILTTSDFHEIWHRHIVH